MSIALFPVFLFFFTQLYQSGTSSSTEMRGLGGGGSVIGGFPRFPYFDVFQYVNCGVGYGIRSTQVPGFYKGVFNPVIPIQIFTWSRNSDSYFRHPAPRSFFQSQSSLPFATGVLNKTVPDPDKSLAGTLSTGHRVRPMNSSMFVLGLT